MIGEVSFFTKSKSKGNVMSTSKIKIKLGPIEVEYEGSETFLKEELPQLLTAVSDLYAKSHSSFSANTSSVSQENKTGTKNKFQATTGSIAAKLGVKSGPELVMAAAARITLVEEESIFPRQKIIDEMKTASAYFRSTYVGNLTATINGLVKDGKLNEPSQGKYALTASSLKDMEQRLV
jgi:hypothetical protein